MRHGRLLWLGLAAVVALRLACPPPARAFEPVPWMEPDRGVLIFVLDSPVDRRFLEGQVAGLTDRDITHGSLVARVIRSYSSAPLRSITAEREGAVDRAAYLAGLQEILDYARARPDVRVLVNVSLGSYERDPDEEALIGQLVKAGVLVVAAAGNDNSSDPFYPAGYPGVVAVASATPSGKVLHSNYGQHVSLSASGDITFLDYEFLPQQRLRREMDARGTSFAAPRVTAMLAYVLQQRPGFKPSQALRMLEETASPIDDPAYGRRLGAGLLNIYRVKKLVSPVHAVIHYALPTALFAALGALSALLLVRHGLVGAFVSLMMWVVGVPTAVFVVLESKAYLEFVGAGDILAGVRASAVLAMGAAAAGLVLRWNLPKTVSAAACGVAALMIAMGTGALSPLPGSVVGALVSAACAAGLEWQTRRAVARIAGLANAALAPDGGLSVNAAALMLARARGLAVDERVKRACMESALRLPLTQTIRSLEAARRRSTGAAWLLEGIYHHLNEQQAARPGQPHPFAPAEGPLNGPQ